MLVGDGTMGDLLLTSGGRLREIARPWVRLTKDVRLPNDEPMRWPTTSTAWCVIDGRLLMARGSYEGVVWVHDVRSEAVVAGPLTQLRGEDTLIFRADSSLESSRVSAVALAQTSSGPVVACASAARLPRKRVVVQRLDGDVFLAIDSPAPALALAAGALGRRDVLVTGSLDGTVAVWDLRALRELCRVSLDHAVLGVWILRGACRVGAQDASGVLHVFDLVEDDPSRIEEGRKPRG